MSKEVSNKILIYNFLMAVLILISHVGFGGVLEPQSEWDGAFFSFWTDFVSVLSTTVLKLYMMMSAFLLYYNAEKGNIGKKLKTRLCSLIIPFFAWNIIYAIYLWRVEGRDIWNKGVLLEGFFGHELFDGPLWFMMALITFLPFFPLLGCLKKKWQSVLAVTVIAVLFRIGLLQGTSIGSWFYGWWFWLGQIYAYFTGYLLARLCPDLILKEQYRKNICAIIGAVALVGIFYWKLSGRSFQYPMVADVISAVCLWLLIPADFLIRIPLNKQIVRDICNTSFVIYASHVLVGKLIIRKLIAPLIYSRGAFSGVMATGVKVISQIAVLLVIIVVTLILQKILPGWILRPFTGGRVQSKRGNSAK